MRYILNSILALVFLTSQITFAEMTLPPKASERQYLKTEWLKDPSFEIGGGFVTSEASTAFYQDAWSTNTLSGRSLSWNPSVAGTLTLLNYNQSNGTEFTVRGGSSGSLRGSCFVKANDATHTYTIEIYDVTNAVVIEDEDMVLSGSNTWNFQSVKKVVTPTSDTLYRLRFRATADENVIYADNCTLGFEEGIQAVNVNQVYSAKQSSTDVVSDENTDWINGNCTNATTGAKTCTFTTGLFTSSPNCLCVDAESTTSGASRVCQVTATSSSAVTFYTYANGAAQDNATILSCQRSEPNSGFAVRMDQTNFGVTTLTALPSSQGYGTISSVQYNYWREGELLKLNVSFTSTTPTGVEARVGLPTGLAVSTKYATKTTVGKFFNGATATAHGGSVMAVSGNTYVTFSDYGVFGNASVAPTANANGSATVGSGSTIQFTAEIPIQGWTSNQNAPLIIGGVTSSYQGTVKTEVANLNCDAASAITSQLGSWVTSIGNVSAGACAVNLVAGVFSSAPYCDVTSTGLANPNVALSVVSATSSTITVDCDGSASGSDCAAYDFNLTCTGPR